MGRPKRQVFLLYRDEYQASILRFQIEVGGRYVVRHVETREALWDGLGGALDGPIVLLHKPAAELVEAVKDRFPDVPVVAFGVKDWQALDSSADWCVPPGEEFAARAALNRVSVRKRGPKKVSPVLGVLAEVA